MKYKKSIIIVLIMVLSFLITDKVDASTRICNRGYAYDVEVKAPASEQEFKKQYVNTIQRGGLDLNIGNGVYKDEVFEFSYMLASESYRDGEYSKCYSQIKGSDYNMLYCNQKYIGDIDIANIGKSEEQTLDINTGTITLKLNASGLSDSTFSRLSIKTEYAGGNAGTVKKDPATKQITISGITPSEHAKYRIYTYLPNATTNDFSKITNDQMQNCTVNGSLYVGTYATTIKSLSEFKLTVPDNFKNSNLCKEIIKFSKEKHDVLSIFPECVSNNHEIDYATYKNLNSSVEAKFQRIKSSFEVSGAKTLDTNNLKCYNPNLGIKDKNANALPVGSQTTVKEGKYWFMSCTDTYYVEASDPMLVKSGVGVNYSNRVKIDRVCSIENIKKVSRKDQCSHGASLLCQSTDGSWVPNAGPNESFDACVKKCDNGKYTQSCINSCYDDVYKNRKAIQIEGVKELSFTDYVTRRLGTTKVNPKDAGVTDVGDGYVLTVSPAYKGKATYTDDNGQEQTVTRGNVVQLTLNGPSGTITAYTASICLEGGFPCKVETYSTGGDCSDNPDEEYRSELNESRNEYIDFITKARTKDEIINYQISFVDTEDGQVYVVDGRSKNPESGVKLQISAGELQTNSQYYNTNGENYVLIGNQDNEESKIREAVQVLNTSIIYNIDLPTQYTIRGDASTILVKGPNDGVYYKKVNNKSGRYKFERFKVDNQALSKGENVYYTTLNGKDFNREVSCEDTSAKSFSSNPNTGTYLEKIVETNNLKNQYEDTKTQKTFYNFWGEHENYFTSLSYNAYAAYILNNRLVVKELKEEYDNINVSFEFESLNDAFGDNTKHVTSKYDCYYGVYNMLDNNNKCEKPGLRYYYHEINLEKIFDKRDPRWNWTGTINGNQVTGAAKKIDGYIVDPERLIASIEQKGYNIYEDQAVQAQEMDYEYTLDNAKIQAIREYNKIREKGQRLPYTKFTLAKPNNTMESNFSMKVAEWLGDGFRQKEVAVSTCNNSLAGSCYNYGLGGK